MAGVTLQIEEAGLAAAEARLRALSVWDEGELLGVVGAVAEGAARRRIAEDKAGPDGVAWAPWSERYAAGRKRGRSLLQSEGGLLDSLAFEVEGDAVRVGSNLVYAAIHQFGGEEVGKPIPARPYLGLSAEDRAEIERAVSDFLDDLLGGAR